MDGWNRVDESCYNLVNIKQYDFKNIDALLTFLFLHSIFSLFAKVSNGPTDLLKLKIWITTE